MKRFVHNLFLFAGAVTIILVLSIVFYCFMFKTPQTSRIPFLGDSTGKASINTKIATQYENYSQGGEAYLFTYYKLKQLIKTQKVDIALINFSPSNLINNEFEFASSEGRERYLPLADTEGQKDLFFANPRIYIKSWIILGKENFHLLKNDTISFGGYTANIKKYDENYYKPKEETHIPIYQTKYLDKIVKLCKEQNIHLVFVNLPKYIHDKNYPKYNRKEFLEFYYKNYSNIDFIDISDFNFSQKWGGNEQDYFADIAHTSDKGGQAFSEFLNETSLSELLKSKYNKKTKKSRIGHLLLVLKIVFYIFFQWLWLMGNMFVNILSILFYIRTVRHYLRKMFLHTESYHTKFYIFRFFLYCALYECFTFFERLSELTRLLGVHHQGSPLISLQKRRICTHSLHQLVELCCMFFSRGSGSIGLAYLLH